MRSRDASGNATRTAIVAARRKLMQAGRPRPATKDCCARTGWARRTGFHHFGPVAGLHRKAIDDVATQHAILRRLVGTGHRAIGREPVRLRGSRDAFRRVGNIARAAHYERRLAAIETRQPESGAIEVGEGRSAP
jgi:hypothetical protein